MPRVADLGAVASMQPIHAPAGGLFPPPDPDTTLRADQIPYAFAWRTLRDAGARMVFSTDWPVAPIEVGRSLKAAVAGTPPPGWTDHRQTLDEALASYIPDAAWLEFTEERKGRLAPGFLADVVVMAQDLRAWTRQRWTRPAPS